MAAAQAAAEKARAQGGTIASTQTLEEARSIVNKQSSAPTYTSQGAKTTGTPATGTKVDAKSSQAQTTASGSSGTTIYTSKGTAQVIGAGAAAAASAGKSTAGTAAKTPNEKILEAKQEYAAAVQKGDEQAKKAAEQKANDARKEGGYILSTTSLEDAQRIVANEKILAAKQAYASDPKASAASASAARTEGGTLLASDSLSASMKIAGNEKILAAKQMWIEGEKANDGALKAKAEQLAQEGRAMGGTIRSADTLEQAQQQVANERILQAKKKYEEAAANGDRAAMDQAAKEAEAARKAGGTIGSGQSTAEAGKIVEAGQNHTAYTPPAPAKPAADNTDKKESAKAPLTSGQLVKLAEQVISPNEGTYTTVNPNDKNALSVGKLQWHANRAYDLLSDIVDMDPAKAKQILGENSQLYKELTNDKLGESGSRWATRTLTSDEKKKVAALLGTENGKKAQDALIQQDVSGYLQVGQKHGITNPEALLYFSDLYNQSPKQALKIVGSLDAQDRNDLDKLHAAAMRNSVMGDYAGRRNDTYEASKKAVGDTGKPSQEKPVPPASDKRSAEQYNAVLNSSSLSVDNKKYLPHDGNTYCNVYTQDVMEAMGAHIPENMRANDIYKWLGSEKGKQEGWHEATAYEAQMAANAGQPTVASWYNPDGGSGHVAVVRPYDNGETFNAKDPYRSVVVSNAGKSNFEYKTLNYAFGKDKWDGIKFYVHD